ncbi:MAG: glycosyltransferase [Patescibacteria group bacterium]
MTEAILYVIIFLTLYFQAFMLLTYVSRSARERRAKSPMTADFPHVAVIVPCFNEESTIGSTVESLKALNYPKDKLEIVLVNDGSTDNTRSVMDAYANDPHIMVIHKENGGKHSAMNLGIERTTAEFIGCLDADSFVHENALSEIIPHFDHENVGAVTASMSVHEPKNALQSMQYAEYLLGIALRHIISSVNGLYVTPGPFSFYRRSVLAKVGGFRYAHQTEDMEMAMRLQKAGYTIENAPRAQVYTKAPHTLWALIKQRTRWTSGFIRNAWDYRAIIGNPRYGVLGLLIMPLGILALVAGMGLFVMTTIDTTRSIASAIAMQGEVPLTFVFSMPGLDWFYFPITEVLMLCLVGISIIFVTMIIGKRISGVPGTLGAGLIWYLTLYSLISPVWLFRSVRDVAFGYSRSWR